jgi:hypothetical protein
MECDLIKLLMERFIEAFADSICLRAECFRFGVLNALESQVQLELMKFRTSSVLSTQYHGP